MTNTQTRDNLYVLIIIIMPIVQTVLCQSLLEGDFNSDDLKGDEQLFLKPREERFFDSVVEESHSTSSTTTLVAPTTKRAIKQDKNYREMKTLLSKVLSQLKEIEKNKRQQGGIPPRSTTKELVRSSSTFATTTDSVTISVRPTRKKKKNEARQIRWGHWTDWSSCSVSCGKGRQIRWRHCLDRCDEAETEMEEKTCQLPACGPSKLFGVIKL